MELQKTETIKLTHGINYLPERHKEHFLRSTKVPSDENEQIMRKLNLLK